jgi:PadR family transcriptional regulator PadR
LSKTRKTTLGTAQVLGASSGLDLSSGLIKLHVLYHASEMPVYGLWLIEELAEHGYRVSPGTLYPLLHSLEESEMLKSRSELFSGKIRRYYKITAAGRRHLKKAKKQLMELIGEILTKPEVDRLIASAPSRLHRLQNGN